MSTRGDIQRGLLLELDPELGSHLGTDDLAEATPVCVAHVMDAGPGQWQLPGVLGDRRNEVISLVVLDGVMSRKTVMGHHDVLELLCAGDVMLLPDPSADVDLSAVTTQVTMTAISEVRFMILGAAFLRCANRWPGLLTALHQRVVAQRDRLISQSLALHLPRAEQRILLTLWLLGERCGRVTTDGLVLPLVFSHETLSRLTGARRPTVSLALAALRESGCVIVRDDGRIVLTAAAEREILACTMTDAVAGVPAGLTPAALRLVA